MPYRELTLLLPCYSIEDFPTNLTGDEAEGMLAAWTALWHPALIAASGGIMQCRHVEEHLDGLDNRLIVVPASSDDLLPSDLPQQAQDGGAVLIRGEITRDAIISQALAGLAEGTPAVGAAIAADFYALGYAYLQVQLLTRQMRYSTSLDEIQFDEQVVAAAQAALQSPVSEPGAAVPAAVRDALQTCFDTLAEERDHYYPIESLLFDMTPVAKTTLGESLQTELAADGPVNLMLTGEVVDALAEDSPEMFQTIRERWQAGEISVMGGEYAEEPLTLMDRESVLGQIRRGQAVVEHHLGRRATVFARRTFGLGETLPQILLGSGYTGAVHAVLDEGKYPKGHHVRTKWEGPEGAEIDSLSCTPLDASRPETFLSLSAKLGDALDVDHMATLVLAHWPGRASSWYHDLQRACSYGGAIGKFLTAEKYFEETESPGVVDAFRQDQYRPPYLQQDVAAESTEPISRWQTMHCRAARDGAAGTLATMAAALGHADVPTDAGEIDRLASSVAEKIPANESVESGYLLLNPSSFTRRVCAEVPAAAVPSVEPPVVAAGSEKNRGCVVVDVPPCGYAWFASNKNRRPGRGKSQLPLAEPGVLRNDYMEIRIHPQSGGIQSIHDYTSRTNRLSYQLALRKKDIGPSARQDTEDARANANYSLMVAKSIRVTAANDAMGEIETTGELHDRHGETLAKFKQTYQAWRGSRVLRADLEITPVAAPAENPWESYFGCRFAWKDESADLCRGVGMVRRKTDLSRIESPDYVEIDNAGQRMTVFGAGRPYYRRVGLRMLDLLLIVQGERSTRFSWGIGIDVPNPHREALNMLTDPIILEDVPGPPAAGNSSWFFHLDAKNMVATNWQPILAEGKCRGFRVRLLETRGKATNFRLRCFRKLAAAQETDFHGKMKRPLGIDNDTVAGSVGGCQWIEIEATFA